MSFYAPLSRYDSSDSLTIMRVGAERKTMGDLTGCCMCSPALPWSDGERVVLVRQQALDSLGFYQRSQILALIANDMGHHVLGHPIEDPPA